MCDEDLIGRVLEEGELVLNIRDYSSFYAGEIINSSDADFEGEKICSVNAIGKESVALAIKKGIVDEEHVKTIDNVPCAQSYVVPRK